MAVPSWLPDRFAELAANDRAAAAAVAPDVSPEDHRQHADEILTSHGGRPSSAEQSANNGAAAPAVDKGGSPMFSPGPTVSLGPFG